VPADGSDTVRAVRRNLALAGTLVLAGVTGALHVADVEPVAVFIVAGIALGGLAWAIGVATESVGDRFGPAVTGVLQSTLGNLPELFIVLFALSAGELVVARTSILGSLFANGLLVLGLAIVAGARAAPGGVMRFRTRLPQDTATLLFLAIAIIVLLGLSKQVGDRASQHEVTISVIGAVVLLAVYAIWLFDYLRSDQAAEPSEGGSARDVLPFTFAIIVLAVAGVAAAFVSDWFVEALDPAVKSLGISKAFTGLVIVAIAGNAVENVVGVTLAAKGKADLAVSVVKNSVAQIAAFLYPALVLCSLAFDTRLTFVLSPVFIGALVVTALAMWQITGDGEAILFEGAALVGTYVVLATLMWFE
jgi:Ca2+:H+ antiporter